MRCLTGPAGAPALYEKLDNNEVPRGVISREPDRFLDIKKSFYLLPIIDHVALSKDSSGIDGRILQVAAAVPNRRARAEELCTTDRRDFRDCIRAAAGKSSNPLTVEVIYVVDLTGSMQPFVDAIAEAMRESAQKFTELAAAEQHIRFGFIGFRDSITERPENEFVTKNFTPSLVDRRTFVEVLRSAVDKPGVLRPPSIREWKKPLNRDGIMMRSS
jgi:serine/threonine-protein kinase PpkA